MKKLSVLMILSVLILSGCDMIPGYKSDNIGEEILESGIQEFTGFGVDLSPSHDHEQQKEFQLFKDQERQ